MIFFIVIWAEQSDFSIVTSAHDRTLNLFLVVLPTFILERRSLLEMYSDFFAHADFYSNIPNGKTPRDRLIAVIKWYLTSFHAGRNGSVAKKVIL